MEFSGTTELLGGIVYRLWLVRVPISPASQSKINRDHQDRPLCVKVPCMSKTTKEIPVWVGGESGQRKRYLKSLEKDLAAELGPDWRNVIELAKDG